MEKLSLVDIEENAEPKSHEENFFSEKEEEDFASTIQIQQEEAVNVVNNIHKNITKADASDEWRVRVKCNRSSIYELRLPNRENTTVAELQRMCLEATGIRAEEKPIIECGFPMRSCEDLPKTCAIGLLGVRNRDFVSVETEASLTLKKKTLMTATNVVAAEEKPPPEPIAAKNNHGKKRKQQKNDDVRDDVANKARRKLRVFCPIRK